MDKKSRSIRFVTAVQIRYKIVGEPVEFFLELKFRYIVDLPSPTKKRMNVRSKINMKKLELEVERFIVPI